MNNNPIGCDALLILRYYLAESVTWLPHGAILWEGAHLAKVVDPLRIAPGMHPVFSRSNLGKAESHSGTDPVAASFSEVSRGHQSLFQACPVSSEWSRMPSKKHQI